MYNDVILENLRVAVASGREDDRAHPRHSPLQHRHTARAGDARTLSEAGVRTVDLLPFHQFGEKKYEELGVPYAYAGVKQLHPESLERYRQAFVDFGLDCRFK